MNKDTALLSLDAQVKMFADASRVYDAERIIETINTTLSLGLVIPDPEG